MLNSSKEIARLKTEAEQTRELQEILQSFQQSMTTFIDQREIRGIGWHAFGRFQTIF